mgnify:CR=1 FL=1
MEGGGSVAELPLFRASERIGQVILKNLLTNPRGGPMVDHRDASGPLPRRPLLLPGAPRTYEIVDPPFDCLVSLKTSTARPRLAVFFFARGPVPALARLPGGRKVPLTVPLRFPGSLGTLSGQSRLTIAGVAGTYMAMAGLIRSSKRNRRFECSSWALSQAPRRPPPIRRGATWSCACSWSREPADKFTATNRPDHRTKSRGPLSRDGRGPSAFSHGGFGDGDG